MIYVYFEKDRTTKGPYPESRVRNIVTFARIGSRYGGPRKVIWSCGKKRTMIRRYVAGKRTYPKSPTTEAMRIKRTMSLDCISRAGTACRVGRKPPCPLAGW